MKRADFLKKIGLVSAGLMVAPAVLLKSQERRDGYTVARPMIGGIKASNQMSMMRNRYWIDKQEWEYSNRFMIEKERALLYGYEPRMSYDYDKKLYPHRYEDSYLKREQKFWNNFDRKYKSTMKKLDD